MQLKKQTKKNRTTKKKTAKKKTNSDEIMKKNDSASINIAMITTISFNLLIRQKNVDIFFVNLKNVNYKMTKRKKIVIDSKTMIFEKYHEFLNVFSKNETNKFSFY